MLYTKGYNIDEQIYREVEAKDRQSLEGKLLLGAKATDLVRNKQL